MITGTPWHVSTGDLAKDERRHRARCIHYNKEEKFCYYRSSNCVGAGQCSGYKEVPSQSIKSDDYYCEVLIKREKNLKQTNQKKREERIQAKLISKQKSAKRRARKKERRKAAAKLKIEKLKKEKELEFASARQTKIDILFKYTKKDFKYKEVARWFIDNVSNLLTKRDLFVKILIEDDYLNELVGVLTNYTNKKFNHKELTSLINDCCVQLEKKCVEIDLDRFIDIINNENDYILKVNVPKRDVKTLKILSAISMILRRYSPYFLYYKYNQINISEDDRLLLNECFIGNTEKEISFKGLKTCIRNSIRVSKYKTVFFDLKKFLSLIEEISNHGKANNKKIN